MSDAKRHTLAVLGPTWMLDRSADRPTDAGPAGDDPPGVGGSLLGPEVLRRAFGRTAPVMLDIGVGTGAATLAWAAEHPDHDVVAVELHRPGIARLLQDGDAAGITNVRVVEADVTRLIAPRPEPTSPASDPHDRPVALAQVRVLFPDPWPKKRHLGRRLVDVTFVRRVTDLLVDGGTLHLATDWPPYADQMRAVIAAEPRLRPQVDVEDETGWRSHRPDRPTTAYERRGIEEGRPITDLIAHHDL